MKQKILFDCERMKHCHTGLYYYCYYLGKNLKQVMDANKEICFYLPKESKHVFGKDACYVRQNSLHKTFLPMPRNTSLWHSTYQGTNYFPSGKDLRIVLTIHDLNFMYDESKSKEKKDRYLRKLEEKVEKSDALVFISKYVQDDLSQYINIEKKRKEIIYNGLSLEPLSSIQPPERAPSKPFLFTIGTIVDKKNFHVLPALLKGNDLYLVIAGITQSEEYKQRIINEAKKYNAENRVIFTGAINENDKQWYYKRCEAFVFPSLSEGFGLPVIEAMHFGKPVLLSRATSLPEVGGNFAHYLNSFVPADMLQALQQLLSERDIHEQEIKAWSEKFSWKTAAQQYMDLYDSLLNENSPA